MKSDLIVSEGVAGVWFYHLSQRESFTRGLCGAPTMQTQIPLSCWGKASHLNERYCRHCEAMATPVLKDEGTEP